MTQASTGLSMRFRQVHCVQGSAPRPHDWLRTSAAIQGGQEFPVVVRNGSRNGINRLLIERLLCSGQFYGTEEYRRALGDRAPVHIQGRVRGQIPRNFSELDHTTSTPIEARMMSSA